MSPSPTDICIISGGQTGADRAALDFAIRHGIPHGGWCPAGRRAEDGPISARYRMRETPGERYDQRTRWNIRDADATLVVTIAERVGGGSALTLDVARRTGKPTLHISQESIPDVVEAGRRLQEFVVENTVRTLNVAGPRASHEPSVGPFVDAVLTAALIDPPH